MTAPVPVAASAAAVGTYRLIAAVTTAGPPAASAGGVDPTLVTLAAG